jgi:hypothetical protein
MGRKRGRKEGDGKEADGAAADGAAEAPAFAAHTITIVNHDMLLVATTPRAADGAQVVNVVQLLGAGRTLATVTQPTVDKYTTRFVKELEKLKGRKKGVSRADAAAAAAATEDVAAPTGWEPVGDDVTAMLLPGPGDEVVVTPGAAYCAVPLPFFTPKP